MVMVTVRKRACLGKLFETCGFNQIIMYMSLAYYNIYRFNTASI